jgi:hypothetical protein
MANRFAFARTRTGRKAFAPVDFLQGGIYLLVAFKYLFLVKLIRFHCLV